jgi:hypothetical protein
MSASKFGKNATAILQNATRCTLKNFGPLLKINLGGDRFLSQKLSVYWTARKIQSWK